MCLIADGIGKVEVHPGHKWRHARKNIEARKKGIEKTRGVLQKRIDARSQRMNAATQVVAAAASDWVRIAMKKRRAFLRRKMNLERKRTLCWRSLS